MSNKRKLIGESYNMSIDSDKLNRLLDNDDPIILEGVIQRANAVNANKRIYPKDVLEREIDLYMESFVNQENGYGELDHPDRFEVEYKTASHIIKDIWWKGDEVIGRIEILPAEYFPCGRILRGVMKISGKAGFSSRGFGSERSLGNDKFEVNNDYGLSCWDAVTNPSTNQAFGFLTEGKGMSLNDYERLLSSMNTTIYSILK